MTGGNLAIDTILSRMELLISTYQRPVASYKDGNLSITYIWISDWAEKEYKRLVFALAKATPQDK